MIQPILEHPSPDFAELERVLKGQQEPCRVHMVELLIDDEILQSIAEQHLGQTWVCRLSGPRWLPVPVEQQERYYRQVVSVYYHLGYDHVPLFRTWLGHPPPKMRRTADTAGLPRGDRDWVEEGYGLITNREEFEAFPWDGIKPDLAPYHIVARHLPPGMKMTTTGQLYEHAVNWLLGWEGFLYTLYDDPELVAGVFERWGQIIYDYYAAVIDMEEIGAIFHGDDIGFRTSTTVSPDTLRQLLFPWLKRYADLAHAHGKMFWLHSCGNVYQSGVIEELIEEVGIDAFHSFQDVILPVANFQVQYGQRVATLGGVDMDKLVRLEEMDLRAYVRDILAQCVPRSRFAMGSGNSIANYVPLTNYLIMLDECRRWQWNGFVTCQS